MKWVNVSKQIPPLFEEVVVWMRYDGHREWGFNTSWIEHDGWAMGSAKGFEVSHWMRIDAPLTPAELRAKRREG